MEHNAWEVAARFRRRAQAVRREHERAAVDIAAFLTEDSRAVLAEEVYGPPVKTSSTGRPLWTRTGRLLAEEGWEAVGLDVRHRNRAAHYIHRWRYGKGGRRALAPQRASSWHRVALARDAHRIRKRRREAERRGLQVG